MVRLLASTLRMQILPVGWRQQQSPQAQLSTQMLPHRTHRQPAPHHPPQIQHRQRQLQLGAMLVSSITLPSNKKQSSYHPPEQQQQQLPPQLPPQAPPEFPPQPPELLHLLVLQPVPHQQTVPGLSWVQKAMSGENGFM